MAQDSKRWAAAYEAYKSSKPNAAPKPRNSKTKQTYNKEKWLETTKEFHRWKKTDDYKKWRKLQFGKQDAKCYYCQKSLIGIRSNVEHIIPRSKGGNNNWKNLVLSCWVCNKEKGSTLLSQKQTRKHKKVQSNKSYQYKQYKEWEENTALELRNMFNED